MSTHSMPFRQHVGSGYSMPLHYTHIYQPKTWLSTSQDLIMLSQGQYGCSCLIWILHSKYADDLKYIKIAFQRCWYIMCVEQKITKLELHGNDSTLFIHFEIRIHGNDSTLFIHSEIRYLGWMIRWILSFIRLFWQAWPEAESQILSDQYNFRFLILLKIHLKISCNLHWELKLFIK